MIISMMTSMTKTTDRLPGYISRPFEKHGQTLIGLNNFAF